MRPLLDIIEDATPKPRPKRSFRRVFRAVCIPVLAIPLAICGISLEFDGDEREAGVTGCRARRLLLPVERVVIGEREDAHPARGGEVEPLVGLDVVSRDALSRVIADPEAELRVGVPLFGGRAWSPHRLIDAQSRTLGPDTLIEGYVHRPR